MKTFCADVLYRPPVDELRFLPEGPHVCAPTRVSWVAIQHGPDVPQGSINILSVDSGENESWDLDGRPGFAYPTDAEDTFVIGLERHLVLADLRREDIREISPEVDADVDGTIINDGIVFEHGIVFGTKDLEFKEPKASLYFWRQKDGQLFRLLDGQTCSNGKVVLPHPDGNSKRRLLLDIDTPTRTVAAYDFELDPPRLSNRRVVLDLRDREDYPDGMVLAPDGESVIIAFYNPGDPEYGQACQFRLSDGEMLTMWQTPLSPRVTCPLLMRVADKPKIILTTAVEHMSETQRQRYANAGCLFIADVPFSEVTPSPVLRLA